MKQRFLSWVLAFVMVIGLLPMAALADEISDSVTLSANGTVTIGETTYKLYLGQGIQRKDGSLGYWLDYVDRGFIPSANNSNNEFRYYLYLLYRNEAGYFTEATKTEYEQFWSACSMSVANEQSSAAGISIGEIGTFGDGYHKYISVSVSGVQSGSVSVVISNNTDSSTCSLSSRFQFTAATELTLDADTDSNSFSIENAVKNQSHFFYIDLGETQTVSVSGTLSDSPVGRLVLAQTAEGTGESDLWQHFSGSDVKTFTQTITTDKLLLRAVNSDGGTISGTVTITVVQSGDNPSGDGNNQPSLPDEPTLSALPTYAFFATQARDRNYYLPHVIWRNLREGDGDTNNDNRFIWLVSETGFTEEQKSKITVETSGVEVDVTGKEIPVQCAWFDRGDNTYDLRVAIPMPKMTYDVVVKLDGTVLQKVAVEYITFGNTYTHEQSGLVIGFALQEAGVTTVTPSLLGMGNYKDERPYDNRKTTSIVAATRQTTGGTDAYTVDEVVTSTLQIKQLWLESVNGDASAFSLSPNKYQTVLTDVSNHSIPLYVRGGHIGTSRLCAEVTGKIGEESFTITVSAILEVYFTAGVQDHRPNDDTVTALNAYLEELAQTINPYTLGGTIYQIYLGNTTYTGTIVLPEEFQGNNIVHIYGSNNTTIQGGIDLNTACVEQIRNIRFTANDDEKSADGRTRALYGSGVWSLYDCTFYGYDIALDSSDGLINATDGNVFVNNEIAAFVDLEDVVPTKYDRNLHRGYWKNNTFINNGTAVQVLSLHRLVPAYHFRIYDSNFINNGTDIDAQCGGTLYMYRNYFGQYQKDKDGHRPHPGKHHADRHNGREHLRLDELLNARTETKLNGILEYTRAKVNTGNETKVITNPRWLHPVKGWWGHNTLANDTFFGPEPTSYSLITLDAEPEYADILVADWESETVILNKESSTLTLDASAFDSAGEKEIGVVDENEKTLGTWNFNQVEGA